MNDLINDGYFFWLIEKIETDQYNRSLYSEVLIALYKTEFRYIIERDKNREIDGMVLRDLYARETKLYPRFYLPDHSSVLEMMIALCIRMDEELLYSQYKGSRISTWFWIMMENLGLTRLMNDVYSDQICQNTLNKFMDRDYKKDGKGGLFYTNQNNYDFRFLEIWYQMGLFVDEFLSEF